MKMTNHSSNVHTDVMLDEHTTKHNYNKSINNEYKFILDGMQNFAYPPPTHTQRGKYIRGLNDRIAYRHLDKQYYHDDMGRYSYSYRSYIYIHRQLY